MPAKRINICVCCGMAWATLTECPDRYPSIMQSQREKACFFAVDLPCVSPEWARPTEAGYGQRHPRPKKPNLEPQEGCRPHLPLCLLVMGVLGDTGTTPRMFLLASCLLGHAQRQAGPCLESEGSLVTYRKQRYRYQHCIDC